MPQGPKRKIVYVTSSSYKIRENEMFVDRCKLSDGTPVHDLFVFELKQVAIKEVLEVDLAAMVHAEAMAAYSQLRVPCIVEHAGLIFEEYTLQSYPGGLTKPMWNALGHRFVEETRSSGRRAIARAIIAYCDGMKVHTFVGETQGTIAASPRGTIHQFYWDTIFIPDDPSGQARNKTYAEIVEDQGLGLAFKITHLSQSSRAMLKFLDYVRAEGPSPLWSRV